MKAVSDVCLTVRDFDAAQIAGPPSTCHMELLAARRATKSKAEGSISPGLAELRLSITLTPLHLDRRHSRSSRQGPVERDWSSKRACPCGSRLQKYRLCCSRVFEHDARVKD